MKSRPWFLILFAPVPVLTASLIYIWQVPWWSGFRLAGMCAFVGLVLFAAFEHAKLPPKLVKVANLLIGVALGSALLAIFTIALIRDTKPHSQPQGVEAGPDIYFIVLDSYTGSQALLENFGYDNSAFLGELRRLGFQVGDCASRYGSTSPTIASLFNGGMEVPTATRKNWSLLQRSQLRTTLEARGYDWIAFATGFDWDEIHDAAYYLAPDLPGATEFELFSLGYPSWNDRMGEIYRTRTLYLLDNLSLAAYLPGSQFTFAHIIQPHPPFVFYGDGTPRVNSSLVDPDWNHESRMTVQYTPEAYIEGYAAQAEYISNALILPLQDILTKDPGALILLLGDHGPWYSPTPEGYYSVLCATSGGLPLEPEEAIQEILGNLP